MKKLIFFLIFSLVFVPTTAVAESLSLAINPLVREVDIEPGRSWTGSVKVFNSNSRDLKFNISSMDFRGKGEGYAQFLQEVDPDYALTRWINIIDEEAMISAHGSREFVFTIEVPEEAAPGGMYAGIIASAEEPEKDDWATLEVSPSVSSLLLVNVEGDYREELNIIEFGPEDVFYDTKDIPFGLKVTNMGNVHVRPEGEVEIYDRGGDLVDSMQINPEEGYGNILPQTERNWSFIWETDGSILETGRYTAKLNLFYGREDRKTVSKTADFWVVPSIRQLVMIVIGLGLFLLILLRIGTVYLKHHLKKKKA